MDIYAEITNRVIAEMEKGVIPWQKPWVGTEGAISYQSGKPYSLLNQILLGEPGEYLTIGQCNKAGGRVKKGEKARMVVFWKPVVKEDEETGEKSTFFILRYYYVFHVNQCEGIEPKHQKPLPHGANENQAASMIVHEYLDREGIRLHREAGNRAFYRPSDDSVTIPTIEQFMNTAEFYSTIFHELTHSTGHEKRLNRISKKAMFGNEEYSKEELVAEIGAAALVNHAGLETASSFKNTAAYIQNWLKVLKSDKRFIVSAAGKAEKAVALILGNPIEKEEFAA